MSTNGTIGSNDTYILLWVKYRTIYPYRAPSDWHTLATTAQDRALCPLARGLRVRGRISPFV